MSRGLGDVYKRQTFKDALGANYTDGLVILHEGRIVYEHYSGCLDAAGKHGAMSMTKSLTGLLAEILVAEGKLDNTALVSSLIPELARSAFGSATVRQVMDMTTALDFNENYADPKADLWVYGAPETRCPSRPATPVRSATTPSSRPSARRAPTATRSATRPSTPTCSDGSSRA